MRLPVLFITAAALLTFSGAAEAGLKVYYIRHGETGGNVEKQWKDKPKSEWPPYVGNSDAFSPLGETQVAAVADKLKPYHFDLIAVSPLWRTRHTILPYLQATGQQAEIWPELTEIKNIEFTPDAATLGAVSPGFFTAGKPIVLPADEAAYFKLRPDAKTELKYGWNTPQENSDRQAAAEKVIKLLKQRFGNGDKSVLLVGHGNEGRYLLNLLAGYSDQRIKNAANTAIWMAEEQPDGTFKVMLWGDQPYVPKP